MWDVVSGAEARVMDMYGWGCACICMHAEKCPVIDAHNAADDKRSHQDCDLEIDTEHVPRKSAGGTC